MNRKASILYVDDEVENLEVFEATFWRNYNLHLAQSADEGLHILEHYPVNLIITDQRMPNITGIEFLEKIPERHKETVRILLTGFSDIDTVIDAVNRGKINHYVTKPWNKAELSRVIENSLEMHRIKEENAYLLQQLQLSNARLQNINSNLEGTVDERTRELQEKNTLLEEAFEKLKTTHSKLIHSEKLATLGMLSAAIGHEINNPIGFVKGQIAMLQRNFKELQSASGEDKVRLENEIGISIEEANQGIIQVSEIIRSLKYFAGEGQLKPYMANIYSGINSTLKLFSGVLYDNHITLERNFQSEECNIEALHTALNQVFSNIITNAIDAINEKVTTNNLVNFPGKIVISTTQNDEEILITFKDNGIGMTDDVLENIFNPFFTTKNEGSGIGMSICQDVVNEHNGKINIKTHPGLGSDITVAIPRR
ncbi:MAG: ATP-binding protein [Cyclobacteriaceae bacterium]|nr:ATP-binding protein [Cyclobacteriaceae bacterium]